MEKYDRAADHMKRYLDLVPDSPDAAAARDKLVIWEEKARKAAAPVPAPPPPGPAPARRK